MKLEFSRQNSEKKILKYKISRNSVHWDPSCSKGTDRQTQRQTDVTKLTVAFRNFANAPNNGMNHLKENLNYVRESTTIISTRVKENVLYLGFALKFLEPNKNVCRVHVV